MRVTGESMNNLISPGDILLVRQSSRSKDGDICVVAQDGGVTVKRRKGRQLISESDRNFAPIEIYDTEDDASGNRVVGVVFGIHKQRA